MKKTKYNRINKSDRLLKYSCNMINWAKDKDGKMWDRYTKVANKNTIEIIRRNI